jgi:hypothetical protein
MIDKYLGNHDFNSNVLIIVTSISITLADCPGIEKETLISGSRREGFNFTGSIEIKNIPNIVKYPPCQMEWKAEFSFQNF